MKKYTFYEDPGHGWLKVSKKDLVSLCIEKQISGYSYMLGDNAYLEEDSDLSIFIEALANNNKVFDTDWKSEEMKNFCKGFWANCKKEFTNNQSKIRTYNSYENYSNETTTHLINFKTLMKKTQNWSTKGINKINKGSLTDCKYWNDLYKIGFVFPE